MPERYPNPQSSSTIKSSKSSKVSKFEQFKSWIETEQEANQAKNLRIAETRVTPIKEITQKALTKLRSTIDSKSFKKVVKGIAATGAVLMMNLGHVNPAEAKSNAKLETSPTKTEQVVTQVVNNDVSSPKAQKLKKDFGFEKVSDTDYSKMLKATYSSSESKYDVQKLKIESETKGIQNLDGTLNRQRAVNKLHFNYLRGIEPMTAPTIGNSGNSKTSDSSKEGQGKNAKTDTNTPSKTSKETTKKDTTAKTAEVKSVTPETKTPTKETSKTINTEAILKSGKINLDSPAVQKLKAHLGLNDLADDQQFKKFNEFVKTNITKGVDTRTLKNSAIEDYLKANPTRPVAPKPELKPTPSTTPSPEVVSTVKPKTVTSPVPSVTETKPSPSPVENPKAEPSKENNPTVPENYEFNRLTMQQKEYLLRYYWDDTPEIKGVLHPKDTLLIKNLVIDIIYNFAIQNKLTDVQGKYIVNSELLLTDDPKLFYLLNSYFEKIFYIKIKKVFIPSDITYTEDLRKKIINIIKSKSNSILETKIKEFRQKQSQSPPRKPELTYQQRLDRFNNAIKESGINLK